MDIPRNRSTGSLPILACLAGLWLSGCATVQPYPPGRAACYERMQRHVAELEPGFAALGYQPKVRLSLDDRMPDAYGLNAMSDVMGDALANGRVRLRASTLCANDALAHAVIAHEMAHVALKHRGPPSTGLVLRWEGPPKQETEANQLALAVLRRTGGHPLSERFLECQIQDCAGAGATGVSAFRVQPPRPGPTAP